MIWEIRGLRKGGLGGKLRSENLVDHVGPLSGYSTGLVGALMLRHYDPKWRDMERYSFWNWNSKRRQGEAGKIGMAQQSSDFASAGQGTKSG